MTHESTPPSRSVSEPNRPSDLDRMNDRSRSGAQPEQEIQPEQGSPRSADEKQIRSRSDIGTARVEQNAGDDVGEASEEA